MKKTTVILLLCSCLPTYKDELPITDITDTSSFETSSSTTDPEIQTVTSISESNGSGSGSESEGSEKPFCGDGKIDSNEECDDGNKLDTDDCVDNCKIAKCGDAYLRFDVEQCDDGILDPLEGCRSDCTFSYKLVFISSEPFLIDPNFSDVGFMDLFCSNLAHDAEFFGEFEVLIPFKSNENELHPLFSRIPYFTGLYRRTNDFMPVAFGLDGLTNLQLPILFDEKGNAMKPAETPIWTGASVDGKFNESTTCDFWTNPKFEIPAFVTYPNAVGPDWWSRGTASCESNARIICVEKYAK